MIQRVPRFISFDDTYPRGIRKWPKYRYSSLSFQLIDFRFIATTGNEVECYFIIDHHPSIFSVSCVGRGVARVILKFNF